MQRKLTHLRRSDNEAIKEFGLLLDLDEIARRGSLSPEEGLAAQWYGIYPARQPGNFMARVLVRGGVLTSAQARAVSQMAHDYAQGRIAFTTRQSIQLHWLKLYALPLLLRDLACVGLSTFHGAGDVTRAVAACPRAAICPHRRLDVLSYAKRTASLLTARRDLDNLPRKLKISFSGCGADCGQPAINCIGFTALVRNQNGERQSGFRVMIGGGLGRTPRIGEELFSFVPEDEALRLSVAIALFFQDQGDRYNRATARLKFVVGALGIERCRQSIREIFEAEGGLASRLELTPTVDCGEPWPARPLSEPNAQDSAGLCIVPVRVPTGELKFRALRRLAELSEMYGDKHLYLTNRQNLEFHGVRPSARSILAAEITKLGLPSKPEGELRDVAVCVGTSYCSQAITCTRDLHESLAAVLDEVRYAEARSRVLINIAGCPNACAPYSIADLGLRGMRIREERGSVEAYQLWLGGTQQRLGHVLGEYKAVDVPAVVRAVLDTFLQRRETETETLADNVARVSLEPYRKAVDELHLVYHLAPAPRELSVANGAACSPLDFQTVARDVPCQHACPAKTNIPEFIRQITLGNVDQAYRLNQETNVMPGVLGRVCTRPCQLACRHLQTSTDGAVPVCHLKRSTADGKSMPAAPLPPWFDATGRRIAVVGGGPAGLAAARELRRYGHQVLIIDRERALGGMLRVGIPAFRLPRRVIDEEVAAIIDSGIQVRLGETVDATRLRELAERFDAVLLAIGATRPDRVELPGLSPELALGGLDFLKRYNTGTAHSVEGDALIVGGGFTAVDCARVARRMAGPKASVRIMYRRTEGQMSATPDELWQLRMEGIEVETLVSPVSARVVSGKLAAVTFQRNVLGEAKGGGKPPFAPIEGSEFEVPCGTLIFAIGQRRILEILPGGVRLESEHKTTLKNLFVAGDFFSGSLDVVHAVADGKAAADAIDRWLMKADRRTARVFVGPVSVDSGRLRDHDLATPRPMPVLPVEERQGDAEVERGFDAEAIRVNAWRCYQCDQKYEIDQDRCIHCNWCMKASPRDCIRQLTRLFLDERGVVTDFVETTVPREATYVWIDSSRCIRCGNCLRSCPTEAISLRRLRLSSSRD